MRVGVLKRFAAILQATRLVSSDCVTAMTMSASSIPASTSVDGNEALPTTVRRSNLSCRSFSRAGWLSTSVMSFCSETRLSASVEPTWPAPRMTIFTTRVSVRRRILFRFRAAGASVLLLRRPQPELLQLAVQVGALEPALLGEPADRALAREMVLEVRALERLARLPQRQVERQPGESRFAAGCGQRPGDVVGADLLLEGGERGGAYDLLQLLEVARPAEVAQCVERRRGELPRRAEARLHELREQHRG